MSILQWHEITPQNQNLVGEQGMILSELASIGLPLTPGFCVTHEFFENILEKNSSKNRWEDLIKKNDQPVEATLSEIQKTLSNLTIPPEMIVDLIKLLPTAAESTFHLTLSPATGLPYNPKKMSCSFFEQLDLTKNLPHLWSQLWQKEFFEVVRKKKINPIVATGGFLIQIQNRPDLDGYISTCNPISRNPFELTLDAKPPKSEDISRSGSRYLLQRDPLTKQCRIKRITHAHLDSGKNLTVLTLEQTRMLAHLATLAAQRLRRPQRLHWFLEGGRLHILGTEPEVSPTLYFPFQESILSLSEQENSELSRQESKPLWHLTCHAPLTPFGMSLDHMFQQTLSQGIRFYKLPLPILVSRYINGFRYQLIPEREPSFFERLTNHFRQKNMEELHEEFVSSHSPKFSELLLALESQEMHDRPLKDQRELIERTLRILLRFIADTSEIRGHLMMKQEENPSVSRRPFIALAELGKKFLSSGLGEELVRFQQWDQLAPQILSRTEGEGLFQEVRKFQDEYGYLWRNGEPTDPGAEEDRELLLFYLRQSLHFPPLSQAPTDKLAFDLKDLDILLYRGISTFRKILLQAGERMKYAKIFQSADDIFFITYEELSGLLNVPQLHADYQRMLGSLLLDRKRTHATWRQFFPPASVPLIADTQGNAPGFPGRTISGGQAEGVARAVRRFGDLPRIANGDILITPYFDEQWLAFLDLAGGVLIDSQQISPAIVHELKRLKKPSLYALADASRLIRDGARIVMDGDHAQVRILSP